MTTAQTETQTETQTKDLAQRWEKLLEEEPKLRIRDAAARLSTGEAQLLATQIGNQVTRLAPKFKLIFEALPTLGKIMASTRNPWAVIEKTGTFDHLDINPHVGLVLNEEIDLRLFMAHFHSAFAVQKPIEGSDRVLRSIQFFDAQGDSLHKVYVKNKEGVEAFHNLINRFAHTHQGLQEERLEATPPLKETPDQEIDVQGFQQTWRDLKDTHDFFGMLRSFGVTRTQALRLAPEGFARPIDPACVTSTFEQARDEEVPIMVFVGSLGCIEIHTGKVRMLKQMGSWFNVLDPDFNLHLNQEGVAKAWIVKKPTTDGIVTSLELFDAQGSTIAMVFGKRKPGIAEDERWRTIVANQQDRYVQDHHVVPK